MRLEGPWQRLAAALSDSGDFLTPLHDQILSPTTVGLYRGDPVSYSHFLPGKGEESKRTNESNKGNHSLGRGEKYIIYAHLVGEYNPCSLLSTHCVCAWCDYAV